MRVFFAEVFKAHETPRGHPESPARLDAALRGVRSAGAPIEAPAPRDDVALWIKEAHEESYIRYVEDLCSIGGVEELDGDTYVSSSTCSAAAAAVSSILTALDLRDNAYILARPPGHHAGRRGKALTAPTQGFCIFNTAAIGALYSGDGIAVVDIDVHHGNGTQEILYERDLLYISIHQDPATLYPGTGFPEEVGKGKGEGYNINMPMPPATGDDGLRLAFSEIVMPVLRQYSPRAIIVSLGWDAHKDDPLADMNFSLHGYKYAIESMLSLGRPVLFLLEGGYNLSTVEGGSLMLAEILSGKSPEIYDEPTESDHYAWGKLERTLGEVKRLHAKYWRF
ncbi:MAG: histone deacetylase family protein [Thermoproteus sp.]|nr:histone deacetylase family protein [Thermoproteus sp.]